MKCKNCAGQYRTIELQCPYCGTENLIGKIWSVQRSEAERAYEEECKKVKKQISSPYMLNRIMNRCIVVLILLYIVYIGGVVLFFKAENKIEIAQRDNNIEEIERQMEEYYITGQFGKLDVYMRETKVDFLEYPTYSQATNMWNSYSFYMGYRMCFDKMQEADLEEYNYRDKEYYLEQLVKYSADVVGEVSDLEKGNEELYKAYQKEIYAYWMEQLGLTEEEIEQLSTIGNVKLLDRDEFIDQFLEDMKKRREVL